MAGSARAPPFSLIGIIMQQPRVVSIHVGKVAPLGPEGVPSAFVKQLVQHPVNVTLLGLQGDEQADLSVHGGPEKAVYAYSLAHYAAWRREYPQHAAALIPGAFGENLCIEGLQEAELCTGDVHRIGSSRLQICQPRQPCFKLALRFDDKLMPKAMIRTGRAGWYYRVLEPGVITTGDTVELDDRPNPDFPFARLVELISHGKATHAELERLSDMKGLASDWQLRARETLARLPPT
jgi:MOSC domain-containing protein YiiM